MHTCTKKRERPTSIRLHGPFPFGMVTALSVNLPGHLLRVTATPWTSWAWAAAWVGTSSMVSHPSRKLCASGIVQRQRGISFLNES